MSVPLINLKPTNPTQEEFQKIQKFGLQPYERSPNDYLRFVAKIFTAWRDPDDKILNFDPYDENYRMVNEAHTTGTTTTLQATSDKSIVAYIDGFKMDYHFTRLTTDSESTNLTSADNIIEPIETAETITYSNEFGEIITINKAKYGEYHRFVLNAGICFIDNQLIQISETTEWWFRVPVIKKDSNGDEIYRDVNGVPYPEYELGQFITDQTKVYSLLPSKKYKAILSYEYITQFDSNSARVQFVTSETAVDEPYLLLGTFSTNEFGMVHQTNPVNESNKEIYLNYITKPHPTKPEQLYYLRDIDNQYLDKKYMANHKNLFKHLQSQLLTMLMDSKIANTFHAKEMKEEIDHSVSSGDFVYFDATKNRWFPAIVSRQDFDRVHGLYLRNASEGTHLLFTSGIIEVDNTYKIVNAENQVLRNLIPGSEYFLVDDDVIINNNAPFIAPFQFTFLEDHFSITTNVIAKASAITITLMNNPEKPVTPFEITQRFNLDSDIGEQRIEQAIYWELTPAQKALLPLRTGGYQIISNETNLVATDTIQFKIELEMVLNNIEETRKDIINAFEVEDLELILPFETTDPLGNIIKNDIKITSSDTSLEVMNLAPNLVGPKKPISNLLAILDVVSPKEYRQFNIDVGDKFLDLSDTTTTMLEIKNPMENTIIQLNTKLYDDSVLDSGKVFGLNNKLALLGTALTDIETTVIKMQEALELTEVNYKIAKMEFQSTASILQQNISDTRSIYLGYSNTKKLLVSQKEILTQKYNAVTVMIDALATKRNSLQDAYNISLQDTQDIIVLVNAAQTVVNTTQNAITQIENELIQINNQLTSKMQEVDNNYTNIDSQIEFISKYKAPFYRVLNLTNPDYNLNDLTKIQPRLLHSMNIIRKTTVQSELKFIEAESLRVIFENSLEAYTTDVTNGSLTFAQQLIRLQEVNTHENAYNIKKNEYQFILTELSQQTVVRNGLYPKFSKFRDSLKGELFAKIQNNNDPYSTWAVSTLVTFTAKIESPRPYTTTFEFVYKDDTLDKAVIVIPAGSIENSFSVYLNSFPQTYVDNGIPRWVASTTDPLVTSSDIMNLNTINENALNDIVFITNNNNTATQKLFTLDQVKYNENPLNRLGQPTGISELNSIIAITDNIMNLQISRESHIVDKILKEDEHQIKINELAYNTNYLNTLITLRDAGNTTMNNHLVEIASINTLIQYYNTTPDTPLVPAIPGSEFSKSTINDKLLLITNALIAIQPMVDLSLQNYNDALTELSVKTDEALGQYLNTMIEIDRIIKEKAKEKINVKILFDLYEEKVKILIKIHDNLKSIAASGIFNGEWVKINTLPLNSFEYQNGLENILLETLDFIALLPYSSFNVANKLEYVMSPNGLSYPTDLTTWIFAKSSGKISTQRYPGATSVGIALNNNTLILNIHHNSVGEISEFLNVYGNSADFGAQLNSIYYSKSAASQKTDLIFANVNLNKKIQTVNTQLANTPVSISRTINGVSVNITTNLNEIEMDVLDALVRNSNNRETLIRLVFAKYFAEKEFDPSYYLFGNNDSVSSWYNTVHNMNLINIMDPFNPEKSKTFGVYLTGLIAGNTLDKETLKDLFYRKCSIYKDIDIIKYILASLPQPLFNYQARSIELKENFTNMLIMSLQKQRLIVFDNPDPNVLDNFENPAIMNQDDLIPTAAIINNFNLMIEAKQSELDNQQFQIDAKRLSHDEIAAEISNYSKYRRFFISLGFSLERALKSTIDTKSNYQKLKSYIEARLISLDQTFLVHYKKTNKQPNIMWDIFRITNAQRTQWNYTYLVLRIKGMQQELNNYIVSNVIQYSPINAELNELKIKKNAALSDGSETLAFVYQTEIDTLLIKKNNFVSILDNYIKEFNDIQRSYNHQTLTSEIELIDTYIIKDLYIQDPEKYNLSYEFAPYPAYKELT